MIVEVSLDTEGLREGFRRYPKATLDLLGREFNRFGGMWQGEMVGRRVLGTRTGNLRQSLGWEVTNPAAGEVRLDIFSAGVPYARAQEFGAEINAKPGSALTVPLRDNLTAAGVPRYPSAAALRDDPSQNTFLLKREGKNPLIVRKTPDDRLEFLWVLVKEVTLPGPRTTGDRSRLGFFDTWDAQDEARTARLETQIDEMLERLLMN